MTTIIEPARTGIARAAGIIKQGGLVAFPTETVYGLGANGLDGGAVGRIYAAKGRPADNPLILHISEKSMVCELAREIPPSAWALCNEFWPGALTIVLKKQAHIPEIVSGGLDSVGIRMPAHPVARELISAAGLPIAAPSANSSGRPSPTRAAHVAHDLEGRIDMILDGGDTDLGLESTVVELTADGGCVVLRPGAVTVEDLCRVLPDVRTDTVIDEAPRAPGMKYTHYSPLAEVILVTGKPGRVAEYINNAADSGTNVGILATDKTLAAYDSRRYTVLSLGAHDREMAARLFGCLREFDSRKVGVVYAEGITERGLGLAIMNRLRKASGGKTVEV